MMMSQRKEGREGRKDVNSERQVQIDLSRFYNAVGEGTWTRKKGRKKNKYQEKKVIIEMSSLSIRCGLFSLIQKREGNQQSQRMGTNNGG